jgi:hypothetical protein
LLLDLVVKKDEIDFRDAGELLSSAVELSGLLGSRSLLTERGATNVSRSVHRQ